MARQLTLIEPPSTWRLDERTREIGRRGIASARAVLDAHRPADSDRPRTDQSDPNRSDTDRSRAA